MLNTIIITQHSATALLIKGFCAKIDFVQLQKVFQEPSEALHYLTDFPVDLVIVDFNLKSMTWMQFISSLSKDIVVISLLGPEQMIPEGWLRNAVYFLPPPVGFKNFSKAIQNASEYLSMLNQKVKGIKNFLYLRADYGLRKITIAEITYIEALDDYLKIHFEKSKTIVVKMTMKKILEKLYPAEFVRVHRSYIVPMGKITNIRKKTLLISDVEIPIGQSYQQQLKKDLDQ
jgi:DNA-binding LytR/AlgR family response regulator